MTLIFPLRETVGEQTKSVYFCILPAKGYSFLEKVGPRWVSLVHQIMYDVKQLSSIIG